MPEFEAVRRYQAIVVCLEFEYASRSPTLTSEDRAPDRLVLYACRPCDGHTHMIFFLANTTPAACMAVPTLAPHLIPGSALTPSGLWLRSDRDWPRHFHEATEACSVGKWKVRLSERSIEPGQGTRETLPFTNEILHA
jgi:hypothetical protein